jgi:hypothetical protein
MAYDFEGDIATAFNNHTVESFLASNPRFPPLVDRSSLPTAEQVFHEALDDLVNTITTIAAETDDQSDDFVQLKPMTTAEIDQAKMEITAIQDALSGRTSIHGTAFQLNVDSNKLTLDLSRFNDFTLDLSRFFAGLDFRQPDLLPPFSGNEVAGFFPDPMFGGIVGPEINLNEDLDGDGVPDILQR